jgi:5-hydroxyisourate hydrolase
MASGGISIHAVDVANGRTAAGMRVRIVEVGPPERLVADGIIGGNGVLDHPSAKGEGVGAGIYEARFFIGEYYAALGAPPGILDVTPFRFVIRDAAQHYHLPLKFTAHGFSLYRGA